MRIDDPERSAEIAQAVDREFANSPAETKTEAEGAFFQGFANQIGNIGQIITLILAAVFFTILLVAGNTMAQAVRERIRELGVLKAVGFTDRGVLGLVLAESCLVTLIGGALGLGLAWLAVTFGGDPTNGFFPVFYLPATDLAMGLVLMLLVGVVTGLLPALQARRLEIADALRR